MRKLVLRWLFLLVLVIPLAAWMWVKPVRLLAPGWLGYDCPPQGVCVEDAAQQATAQALYDDALMQVLLKLGPVQGKPRVVFCSTDACAQSFGMGGLAALTFGVAGTAVSPRGWQSYYVQHELIHHLQAQHWGVIAVMFKPGWVIEGMAYALSGDPRPQLPEPYQAEREAFRAWLKQANVLRIWELL